MMKCVKKLPVWILPLAFGISSVRPLHAQSPADFPGVIINSLPVPGIFSPKIYVSDPCFLRLSNGNYLASHALFGSGSGSATSGRTQVFRSTDGGLTWTKANGGNDLTGILRGSLFEHGGAVYLLGANDDASGNNAVLRKSTNNGNSWTTVSFTGSGFATPDNVLPFADRLWLADTTSSFSAATSSDLSLEASWNRQGGFPAASNSWLPGTGFNTTDNFIGEGQMTASPGEGLVIMPKVRLLPYTALARVNPVTGVVAFDPDRDFVPLQGGEKKFGVRYDAVSGKYFMLANPILPIHSGSSLEVDLIRNTAAVYTSTDLRHWKLEKIFLYSPNIDYEGFQYFNFEFDGNDIVMASRTGFDIGTQPSRGHDSNLLTFHRIPNFRNLTRDLYLKIESGQVRRHERTQHKDAPLGVFGLGTSFAGAPLTNPNAMGINGAEIIIREAGGRILRFDATGNFLGTLASAPVPLTSANLNLPPPAGAAVWKAVGSGTWAEPLNWQDWTIPGGAADVAVFGSAATGSATVTLAKSSLEWNFNTTGNFESWNVLRVGTPEVIGGVLKGTVQADGDPSLQRLNLNFSGDDVAQVRVRLRVNASGNVPVDVLWGNWTENTFNSSRSVRINYTGNGAFQDVTFSMTGRTGWTGERITRIRVDPVNGTSFSGAAFEVDSISLPTAGDSTQLAGLRFTGPSNYTLQGTGSLKIQPASGPGRMDVGAGSHTISLPVELAADSTADIQTGATLALSGVLSGNQPLTKQGGGTLTLSGNNNYTGETAVTGGSLKLGSAAALGATGTNDFTYVGTNATVDLNGQTTAERFGISANTPAKSAFQDSSSVLTNSGTEAGISGDIGLTGGKSFTVNGTGGISLGTVAKSGGTGSIFLTKAGNNTLTLGGTVDNSFLNLTVSNGLVVLDKTTNVASKGASTATVIGGTLRLAGDQGNQINSNITVNAGGVLDLNGRDEGGGTTTLNGTGISDGGALVNNAVSTTSLFNPATMIFGSDSSIGGSGAITINSGTSGANNVTKVGNGTLTLGGTADNNGLKLIVSSGLVVLNKTTSATSRGASTATVNGGTLRLAGDQGDQINSALTINGGIVDLNGRNESLSTIAGTGGTIHNTANSTASTLTLTGAGSVNYAGVIADNAGGGQTGTLGLTKIGTGTLTLAGNNTYTGDTTVSGGILSVTAPNFDDDSTVRLGSETMLNLPNAGIDLVGALVINGTPRGDGLYTFGTGQLQVGTGGFSRWITGTFTNNGTVPGGQQGPTDDPDHDGIANLLEFAIAGQDPTVPNTHLGTFTDGVLSFSKSLTATGITYAIEESIDLGSSDEWTEVPEGANYVNDEDSISYDLPVSGGKNFIRLRVQLN